MIELKERFKEVYQGIKKEMIGEIISESKSIDLLESLIKYEEEKSKGQRKKLKKKQSYNFGRGKEND